MALVIKEPYGVVVGMAPWNAALLLGVRAVAAPIACGNTVVYILLNTSKLMFQTEGI
jgi:acyl-CoA reductase-like NAD-dependent aldehyde dehydrogenase